MSGGRRAGGHAGGCDPRHVSDQSSEARRYLELGIAEAAKIADDDDRAIIETDLATIDT